MPMNFAQWDLLFGTVIAFAIVIVCGLLLGQMLMVILKLIWPRSAHKTISQKPTLFDVRELLLKGEREQAVRLYRQIFKTDHKTAQNAVHDLERSLIK